MPFKGVEFVDPADVQVRNARNEASARRASNRTPTDSNRRISHPPPRPSPPAFTPVGSLEAIPSETRRNEEVTQATPNSTFYVSARDESMNSSTSGNNLLNAASEATAGRSAPLTRVSPSSLSSSRLRFHTVKGINITTQGDDTVATRKHGEYYLGYVFTERPIRIDEKLVIMV